MFQRSAECVFTRNTFTMLDFTDFIAFMANEDAHEEHEREERNESSLYSSDDDEDVRCKKDEG